MSTLRDEFTFAGRAALASLFALLLVPVSASAAVTLEAESMRLQEGRPARDASASGGRAIGLSRAGSARSTRTTGAIRRVAITVRMHRCAGRRSSAVVVLAVDGDRVLRRRVTSSRWKRHVARVALPPGAHRFRLRVQRAPASRAGCLRPLRLDAIRLVETSVEAPTAPAPSPAPAPPTNPVPDPLAAPGRVLFTGDFETGDLSQWSAVHRQTTERIRVVSSPVRQGRYAARHELREGDLAANGERAEVLWGGSASPTLREGTEHYIAWSTYFPAEFPAMEGRQLFMQTHPVGSGFPPIEMRCDDGRISLDVNNGIVPWAIPLQRGVWHDFVLYGRWSADPSVGLIELWHNGRKVVSGLRVPTLEARGIHSYLKVGYYRPGDRQQPSAWVFQDSVRVGTTLGSVTL